MRVPVAGRRSCSSMALARHRHRHGKKQGDEKQFQVVMAVE